MGEAPLQLDTQVANLFFDGGGTGQGGIEAQAQGTTLFGELHRFHSFQAAGHLLQAPAAAGTVLVLGDGNGYVQVKLHESNLLMHYRSGQI